MINRDRLIKTFIELVKIDSPSGEEAAIAEHVAQKLKNLGAKVEFDSYGNVIAKLSGEGEPLMLNAHLDTVEPGRGVKPVIEGDIIRSDGTTVLGGDCKAGVSTVLEALTSAKEDGTKTLPIEVVFTLGEEIGCQGAMNLDYSKITAKRGVTFDEEEDVFNMDLSSPTYISVDVTITGRSAHAGVEPEKGLSAIKIASELISLLEVGRIDEETTANVGLIEGGSARNAVPERAHFKGEIRSRNKQKLEKHQQHFKDIFSSIQTKYPEAKIEFSLEETMSGYLFNQDHPMIVHVSGALQEFGLEPNLRHSGGGSDVNVFHTKGIEAVIVGNGDHNAHTTREFVDIPQMLLAAQFAEKLIKI